MPYVKVTEPLSHWITYSHYIKINIGPSNGGMINPSIHRSIVLYSRLSDFWRVAACLPASPTVCLANLPDCQPASQPVCLPSCNDETMELGLEKYKVLFNFRKYINSRYFNTSQNWKKNQREIIFSNVLIKNFLSA